MNIDHNSSVPLYKQIEDYIRDLINSGEYDDEKLLPQETELAKKFGVSRNTVRQGMFKLVMEGLLVRKKGLGTKVAPQTITTQLDEWQSFSQEMNQRGVTLKNYSVEVKEDEADEKISQILNIQEGRKVIRLERLRGDEKEPFVYFVSWFHPRIELTGKEDFTRPLYAILENEFSIRPGRSAENLKAINADKKIAERLNIDNGVPILFRERKVYDIGDRIIEYNIGFYRGDKFTYSIDIK